MILLPNPPMFDDFDQYDYTDPDTARDPDYEGMAIETIIAEIERAVWEDEMQREQMQYEQNGYYQ